MATTLFLSGGASNADPAKSIGGGRSSVQAPFDLLLVPGDKYTAGTVLYRCVYVRPTDARDAFKAFVQSDTPSPTTTIALGWGSAAIGATEPAVTDENTAPSGVSFQSPASEAQGINGGNFAAGQERPLWIRVTINAGSQRQDELFTLGFGGLVPAPTPAPGPAPAPSPIPAGANESLVMLNQHISVPYTRIGISAWETPFLANRKGARQYSYGLNRYCSYSGSRNLCTSLGYLMADSSRYTDFRAWIAYHASLGAKVLVQIFPENLWGASPTITLAQAQQWRDAIINMLTVAEDEAPGTVYGLLLGNEPTFPNEPGANPSETWRGGWPSGSSTLYALHARLAKQTVAVYFPSVKILGPEIPSLDDVRVNPTISAMATASAAGHDIGWGTGAGTFLKDWIDEFTWHGYLWTGGTFNPLDGGFAAINTLIAKLQNIGFTKPIAQTEFMVTYPGNGNPNASWAEIVEKVCRKHPAEFATGVKFTINFEWGSDGGPNAVFDNDSEAGERARAWWERYVRWWQPATGYTIGRIAQLNDGRIRVYRSDGDTLVIPTDLTSGKFGPNPGDNVPAPAPLPAPV